MGKIINFLWVWIIPIGFVKLLAKLNDNLFTKDSIGEQSYWRVSECKGKKKGANILIRRS
jgi:hypothetical protein